MEYAIRKISIILATYNEKENIGRLIDEISIHLKDYDYEIIVVDDDSPDKTWVLVEKKCQSNKNLSLIRRIDERGLTSALNCGIRNSSGDVVVWLDCDFQMPPNKILELIHKIESGYDVAVGSRFVKDGGDDRDEGADSKRIINVHKKLSAILCRFTSRIYKTDFTDWTSGFIAIKRKVFEEKLLYGDYGEYFIYLMHHVINSNYKYIEVPYVLVERLYGESKTTGNLISVFTKGIKYLRAIFILKIIELSYYKIYVKSDRD
mgnify:CR=1 FL=1